MSEDLKGTTNQENKNSDRTGNRMTQVFRVTSFIVLLYTCLTSATDISDELEASFVDDLENSPYRFPSYDQVQDRDYDITVQRPLTHLTNSLRFGKCIDNFIRKDAHTASEIIIELCANEVKRKNTFNDDEPQQPQNYVLRGDDGAAKQYADGSTPENRFVVQRRRLSINGPLSSLRDLLLAQDKNNLYESSYNRQLMTVG